MSILRFFKPKEQFVRVKGILAEESTKTIVKQGIISHMREFKF